MKLNEIRTGVIVSCIISCRFNLQQNKFQPRKIYPSNLIDVLLILCLLNAFFMLRDETRGRGEFGERGDTPLQSQESLSRRENYSNTSGEF